MRLDSGGSARLLGRGNGMMKWIIYSMLLVGSLALIACQSKPVSSQPDWELARRHLHIKPDDCQKAPVPDNRGAKPSEMITVGDTVSLQYEGWRYTWRLESVNGTNVVLKPVDANRIK